MAGSFPFTDIDDEGRPIPDPVQEPSGISKDQSQTVVEIPVVEREVETLTIDHEKFREDERVQPQSEVTAKAQIEKLQNALHGQPGAVKKKKKPKSKSAAQHGPTALSKKRGNGFEEYFADPPMTPDEALEEKNEIYADNLSFEERMQNCIQRFRCRRRLQGELTLFFSEYLFLGGVDTNPGAFSGLSQQDLKNLTPAQRREATATDVIYGTSSAGERFYDGDKDNWSVDFTSVAAGFISVRLPILASFELDRMMAGIGMIENFLRYILYHDVCAEHEADIGEALLVCTVATEEWPMLKELHASLPGLFNLAAVELFALDGMEHDWVFRNYPRPSGFAAKGLFYASLALLEESSWMEKLGKVDHKMTKQYERTLEIAEVSNPPGEIVQRFKSICIGDLNGLSPIGSVIFKPAIIEDDWYNPMLEDVDVEETVTLYFDDDILVRLRPGMRLTMTICELDIGFKFVKTIEAIVPTFYTYLPQELMRHYKIPRENDRPAPSVDDLDAEEKQFAAEAKAG